MVSSFRAISELPKGGLEVILRIVALIGIALFYADTSVSNRYINSYFRNENQFTRSCNEKIEKNIVDDEVREYLGRRYNKFSGLVNASRNHL